MRELTTLAACLFVVCPGYALAQEEPESDEGVIFDLSTGEQPARISAIGSDCRIEDPLFLATVSDTLVVDAGPLMFRVSCITGSVSSRSYPQRLSGIAGDLQDIFGSSRVTSTSTYTTSAFYIVAEPGRTYEADLGCVRMASQEAAADDEIAVCELGILGGRVERPYRALTEMARAYKCNSNKRRERPPRIYACVAKRQVNTATIGPGRTQNQENCWPSAGNIEERVLMSLVEAGPIVIDASCVKITETDESTIKTSSFSFDAEPEHMYSFSGEDENCMRLLDVTFEEVVIACEPYH